MAWGSAAAVALFVGLYAVMVREWVHRALAALAAATLAVAGGLITPGEALAAVDWNTLVLLFGLMLLAGAVDEAGWFRRFGDWARRRAGASPRRLLVLFALVAAGASAVLPNLAVVLVLAPPLVSAVEALAADPVPPLVALTTAANFGGMATLVGDPPNVLIGSAAHLSFEAFLVALGPPAALAVAVALLWTARTLPARGAAFAVPPSPPARRPAVLLVLLLTVAGFLAAPRVGWPVGLVGLAGGVTAALVGGREAERVLAGVDWGTILFLGGLFVVVGALEHQGVIAALASRVGPYTRAAAFVPLVLAGSAVVSALLDNVPLVAAAIPVLGAAAGSGAAPWWALAAGAGIGGNATLVGSSANIVAASVAAERGFSLSFGTYWRHARGVSAAALGLAGLWLVVTQGG
jgi:Na+/H+ antiporter NhaD/arsenite permease-like protein